MKTITVRAELLVEIEQELSRTLLLRGRITDLAAEIHAQRSMINALLNELARLQKRGTR